MQGPSYEGRGTDSHHLVSLKRDFEENQKILRLLSSSHSCFSTHRNGVCVYGGECELTNLQNLNNATKFTRKRTNGALFFWGLAQKETDSHLKVEMHLTNSTAGCGKNARICLILFGVLLVVMGRDRKMLTQSP